MRNFRNKFLTPAPEDNNDIELTLPFISSHERKHESLSDEVKTQVDTPSSSRASQYEKNFNSWKINFFHALDKNQNGIPILDIWNIVWEYYQDYTPLCDRNTGVFFLDPVVFNHAEYKPVVTERATILKEVNEGKLTDIGITPANLGASLIPIPIILHLIERLPLGSNWFVLDIAENPEEKDDLLQSNSQKILSVLKTDTHSNLSIKLSKLLSKAMRLKKTSVDLRHILYENEESWLQIKESDPLPHDILMAMPVLDSAVVGFRRGFLLLIVSLNLLEPIVLVMKRSSNLKYYIYSMSPGYTGMQYMIYKELTESALWKKRSARINLMITGILLLNLLFLLDLFPLNRTSDSFYTVYFYLTWGFQVLKNIVDSMLQAGCSIILLNNMQSVSLRNYKDMLKNTIFVLPFLMPFIIQKVIYFEYIDWVVESRFLGIPYPLSTMYALLQALLASVPSVLASSFLLEKSKEFVTGSVPSVVVDDSRLITYSKYTARCMSVVYVSLLSKNFYDNPFRAAMAGLSMLNESFLPDAIRTANFRQRLFAYQKPLLMPASDIEPEEKKVERVGAELV